MRLPRLRLELAVPSRANTTHLGRNRIRLAKPACRPRDRQLLA